MSIMDDVSDLLFENTDLQKESCDTLAYKIISLLNSKICTCLPKVPDLKDGVCSECGLPRL